MPTEKPSEEDLLQWDCIEAEHDAGLAYDELKASLFVFMEAMKKELSDIEADALRLMERKERCMKSLDDVEQMIRLL